MTLWRRDQFPIYIGTQVTETCACHFKAISSTYFSTLLYTEKDKTASDDLQKHISSHVDFKSDYWISVQKYDTNESDRLSWTRLTSSRTTFHRETDRIQGVVRITSLLDKTTSLARNKNADSIPDQDGSSSRSDLKSMKFPHAIFVWLRQGLLERPSGEKKSSIWRNRESWEQSSLSREYLNKNRVKKRKVVWQRSSPRTPKWTPPCFWLSVI